MDGTNGKEGHVEDGSMM